MRRELFDTMGTKAQYPLNSKVVIDSIRVLNGTSITVFSEKSTFKKLFKWKNEYEELCQNLMWYVAFCLLAISFKK